MRQEESSVRFPLVLFLWHRVAILAISGISNWLDPRTFRPRAPLKFPSFEALCAWDCGWYVTVAEKGYQEIAAYNFFPLFPLMGRWMATVTGLPVAWTLVACANVFGALALVAVYRVFLKLADEASARWALLLFVAFPFSFFQAVGYPESIMVWGSAQAIVSALENKPWRSGVALGLATLARHLSALAGAAVLLIHLRQFKSSSRGARAAAFASLVVAALLGSSYLFFIRSRLGSFSALSEARSSGWGSHAWSGLGDFFRGDHYKEAPLYVWMSLVPGAGAFALLLKQPWRVLAPFALGFMVLVWSIGLAGLGRYSAGCWAAFLPLGYALARREVAAGPIVMASAMVQGLLVYLFSHSYPIN